MAPITFVDTHNMIAFLTKSDASEGFDQIVDFLNAHTIQYALMVNPPIYVLCIKQFWASVSVEKSNDVVKLQALIDRKKVVVTEDTIRQDLQLDDADSVECVPNKEIFVELARMGYEKPPPKLTFYKAFFSVQWKFLIHTIVQCMSVKRTAWNEFSSSMASAVICLAIGGLVRDFQEWRLLCLTLSSPPQEQPTQPTHTSQSSMNLLNKLMETCATLTQKVAHLEQDKVAQALEITKLKQRVRKLEKRRRSKHSGLKRGEIAKLDVDEDVTLVDVDTTVEIDADTQRRMEEDVTAVKEVNAAKPTVFDDKEVTMTIAQTLIKIKAKKARILDEQMAKRLQDEEIEQAAAKEKQEKEDLKRAKVRPIFEREYNHIQTFLKSDRDEEPTNKIAAKETMLQESFKKLRAEVEVSEKDYPLSNQIMTLMLSSRLQVEEDSEVARDLVMKIFLKANQPKSKSLDTFSN
uniref:Xylulose kinase-1 n=1 Tax=Tanacetum cinerariifolium TaxID=118510 RepID=A0A6L2J683_TANCI|nr:hypothetical protein [Tanacetum cinerariifolium]